MTNMKKDINEIGVIADYSTILRGTSTFYVSPMRHFPMELIFFFFQVRVLKRIQIYFTYLEKIIY